jgi:hypothetical protein
MTENDEKAAYAKLDNRAKPLEQATSNLIMAALSIQAEALRATAWMLEERMKQYSEGDWRRAGVTEAIKFIREKAADAENMAFFKTEWPK